MRRLANTVSDWKEIWQLKGNDAKPIFITQAVWEGLIRFWSTPQSVRVSAKCSTSRLTVGEDGLLPTPHTAGQTPFAGVRLQMVSIFFLSY